MLLGLVLDYDFLFGLFLNLYDVCVTLAIPFLYEAQH